LYEVFVTQGLPPIYWGLIFWGAFGKFSIFCITPFAVLCLFVVGFSCMQATEGNTPRVKVDGSKNTRKRNICRRRKQRNLGGFIRKTKGEAAQACVFGAEFILSSHKRNHYLMAGLRLPIRTTDTFAAD
jgi:hypothetical protein